MVKPERKPKKVAKPEGRGWKNLLVSDATNEKIERLVELLGGDDALGEKPSKHRAIAVAVQEAIAFRERGGR